MWDADKGGAGQAALKRGGPDVHELASYNEVECAENDDDFIK